VLKESKLSFDFFEVKKKFRKTLKTSTTSLLETGPLTTLGNSNDSQNNLLI